MPDEPAPAQPSSQPERPPQPAAAPEAPQAPRLFSGAKRRWRFVLAFVALSFAFLALQVWHQYAFRDPTFETAMVRGAGLAGATFITFALLSSVLFKFRPRWARFWPVRRSLGVVGFAFVAVHVSSALTFYFPGDPLAAFAPFGPQNPLVFGAFAFAIFAALFLTSTDWAVARLGTRWKALHRLVYFAYYATVIHFVTINPAFYASLPGAVLGAALVATLLGELYWFLRTRARLGWKGRGALVGYLIILLWLAALALAFGPTLSTALSAEPNLVTEAEQQLSGTVLRTGLFTPPAEGTAQLLDAPSGRYVTFTADFSIENAPSLAVALSGAAELPLGPLRALRGEQAYPIPASAALSEYDAVIITSAGGLVSSAPLSA